MARPIGFIRREGDMVVINGRPVSHEIAQDAWAQLGLILREWEEEDPIIFDWSCIPSWHHYVAQDSDGRWYSYSAPPGLDSQGTQWMPTAGTETEIPEDYWPKNYKGSWVDSPMVRPEESQ